MTRTSAIRYTLIVFVALAVASAPLVGGAVAAVGPNAPANVSGDADPVLDLVVVEETDERLTLALSTTADDVAGYQAEITYDESAATVTSIEGGEGAFDAQPVTNVDDGWAAFNHALGPGGTEDAPVLATVTLELTDDGATPNVELDPEESLAVNGENTPIDGGDGGDGSDGGDGGDGSDGGDGGDGSDGNDGGDGGNAGTGGAAPSSPPDEANQITAGVEATAEGATATASGLAAGDTAQADFDGAVEVDGVAVNELSITVAEDVDDLGVETRLLAGDDLPADTDPLAGASPVSYVEFSPDGFESDAVETATVSFAADADRLPDGAVAEDVSLFRFVDGDWEELPTTHEGDDAYVAETPGFSVFAVGTTGADLSVTGASLDAESVAAGDGVETVATVENEGSAAGFATLSLTVDGETVDEREVDVPAGEAVAVAFETTVEETGEFAVAVDGVDAGSLTVTEGDDSTGGADAADDGADDASGPADDAGGDGPATEPFGLGVTPVAGLVGLLLCVAGVAAVRRR